MGIFDRVSRLIKSNANSAIDKMQDTSKEVEQLLVDMEEQLRKARVETQKGMAAEKLSAARVVETEKAAADWGRRAEDALRAGDEALAKEALEKQRETEETLVLCRREQAESAATSRAQREALKKLEGQLREAKMKKGTIQAKVNLAKNQDLSTSSLDEFERMSDKVDDGENRLEAERELSLALDDGGEKNAALEEKFKALPASGAVEDRLAALKKKMEK